MTEPELVELAGEAGLRVLGPHDAPASLPVKAAWLIVSCTREDGRRDIVVDREDPHLQEKANSAWVQLASDSGLFGDENGEFLLGVDWAEQGEAPVLRWSRVQLMDEWDVMGAGMKSGLLGARPLHPEFVMMSLDGKVVLRGTTWGKGIGLLTVSNVDRVPMIKSYVERLAANPRTSEYERTMAQGWLAASSVE